MSSNEWGILFAAVIAVATPNIIAWASVFVRLGVLNEKLIQRDHDILELRKEIQQLWENHNHQENRIYGIDKVVSQLVTHTQLPINPHDWQPKAKPNVNPRYTDDSKQ